LANVKTRRAKAPYILIYDGRREPNNWQHYSEGFRLCRFVIIILFQDA